MSRNARFENITLFIVGISPNSKSVEGSNDYGLTFEQTPLAEISNLKLLTYRLFVYLKSNKAGKLEYQ